MGPERWERRQERSELGVERRKKVESLIGTGAGGRIRRESGARGEVAAHGSRGIGQGIGRGEDGKAGDEGARLARGRGKILRGEMEARERFAR